MKSTLLTQAFVFGTVLVVMETKPFQIPSEYYDVLEASPVQLVPLIKFNAYMFTYPHSSGGQFGEDRDEVLALVKENIRPSADSQGLLDLFNHREKRRRTRCDNFSIQSLLEFFKYKKICGFHTINVRFGLGR